MRPTEPAISILFVKGHSPWQEQKRLGAKGRCGVKQNAGQRRPPRQRCLRGSERVATCNSFFLPRGCSPGFVPRRAAAGLPVIGIGIYWSSKPQRGWRAASDLDAKPGQRYLMQTAPLQSVQSVHEATGLQIGCGTGTGCGKSAASAVDATQAPKRLPMLIVSQVNSLLVLREPKILAPTG